MYSFRAFPMLTRSVIFSVCHSLISIPAIFKRSFLDAVGRTLSCSFYISATLGNGDER